MRVYHRYRRRLLQLLETSNLYTPSTLLTTFPTHDLFEERALLLGKLGQVRWLDSSRSASRCDLSRTLLSLVLRSMRLPYACMLTNSKTTSWLRSIATRSIERTPVPLYMCCGRGLALHANCVSMCGRVWLCVAVCVWLCVWLCSGGREGKDVYLTLLRAYTNPPRHKSRRNRSRTALGGLGLAGGGHYSSDGGEEGWVSSGSFRDHRGDSDGEGGGDGGDGDDDDKASGEDTQELIERIGAVMQILATNVSRVDTTRVIEVRRGVRVVVGMLNGNHAPSVRRLQLLPTFVPVALVCPLLEGVIRHQSDTQRQLQVQRTCGFTRTHVWGAKLRLA